MTPPPTLTADVLPGSPAPVGDGCVDLRRRRVRHRRDDRRGARPRAREFGVFATALVVVGFFQTLLDLTVEESLTKYGFRYVAGEDWGRLRRLFRQMLLLKVVGGALATLLLVALAPVRRRDLRRRRTWSGAPRRRAPPARPGVRERRRDGAAPAQPLRPAGRLPGGLGRAPARSRSSIAAPHRRDRGARRDRRSRRRSRRRDLGRRRSSRCAGSRRGARASSARTCRGSARSSSSRASRRASSRCGRRSSRCPRRRLGPTQVGLFRIAQTPQTGLAAASSPARLVLLTEQTRDWEKGARSSVLAGIRSYSKWAGALMLVAVPVFFVAMPWLVEVVFGSEYDGAVARRAHRPARRRDPLRDRLDEVAARHHRPAAAAHRHARARDARRDPARRRARRRVGRDGRGGRRARLDRRVRRSPGSSCSCACATRWAPPRARARPRSSREGRRRLRDLAARSRRAREPCSRARGLPRRARARRRGRDDGGCRARRAAVPVHWALAAVSRFGMLRALRCSCARPHVAPTSSTRRA